MQSSPVSRPFPAYARTGVSGGIPASSVQIVVASMLIALMTYGIGELIALDTITLCNLSTAAFFGTLWWVARMTARGMWSASFVFILVFGLFHFGMTFVTGLDLPLYSFFETYRSRWFFTEYNQEAIALSTIGVLSLGLGVRLGLLGWRRNSAPVFPVTDEAGTRDARLGRAFAIAGTSIMCAAVAGWAAMIFYFGVALLLTGTYLALLGGLKDAAPIQTLIYFSIGLSAVLLGAAPPSKIRRNGFIIFALWSFVVLPLGLRGEVLFPLAAALVVLAMRKPPFSGRRATFIVCALCVVGLMVISFVRAQRDVGLGAISSSSVRFSPFDALAEMGGSIRPVTLCIQWRDEGDEFLYGASYWAPFDRAISRFTPNGELERLPATEDPRLMNMVIIRRGYALGFSPVAEAYRNFGRLGVPFVLLIIGFIVGRLDRLPATRLNMAISGILLFPLLYNVRNAFVPLPSQVIIGGFILLLIVRFSRVTGKRKSLATAPETTAVVPYGYRRSP